MTFRRYLLLVLLGLSWTNMGWALEASVDRTRLLLGDSLELTLETVASSRANRPDLSPLESHFEVRASRQLSLISQLDGRTRPVTRWIISLRPREAGYLEIPPLNLNGEQSEAISLMVLTPEQAAEDAGLELAPIFIDSEVDNETPYVQAQVLLTLRVFHSVSLYDDSILSGLDIPDARVERLGEPHNYEQVIGGIRHGVIEARYAIYPQRSGNLEIPAQLFSATILVPRDPGERFSARSGQLMQVRSPSIQLAVQPIPAAFPADAQWLPARQLSLQQHWQPDPEQDLLTGEPLTRTIHIQASGVLASQLPGLNHLGANADPALRLYADQPQLTTELTASGAQAEREDSAAIVAQQGGEYLLDGLTLPWWDIDNDRLEIIRLEPQALRVKSTDSFLTGGPQAAPGDPAEPVALIWPWQLFSAVLALALASSIWLLVRTRRRLLEFVLDSGGDGPVDLADNNPLADLQAACRHNHPAEARKALEAWAKQQDSDGLLHLSQEHPELAVALEHLNASLFGQNPDSWRGKQLWRAVRRVIQEQRLEPEAKASELPDIYPKT
ncbi:BatD family protein [Halopseudomonas salegens]|uniref:Oxygen tolerance n=1 Tax=Halopseudomonas salegens TaxID=1434072 RepID=A0A1H2EYD4_9GAMM|nr:BatD family protein [Halopseudomonas salegens]SDU00146.1 Oxygen tolerance [Halopseudomonas salegens]